MEEIQKNFEAERMKNQPIKEKLKGPLGEILFCVCAFLVTIFLFFTLKPQLNSSNKNKLHVCLDFPRFLSSLPKSLRGYDLENDRQGKTREAGN